MFISCPAKKAILEIPESGEALLAGIWNPGEEPLRQQTLVKWQEGRISSIERAAEDYGRGRALPWSEYALGPGLIDAHVHLALDALDFNACLARWNDSGLMESELRGRLRRYLEAGIVLLRDGGDFYEYGWKAKNQVAAGKWLGPEIISVREGVNRKGMYGRFLGRGFQGLAGWQEEKGSFFARGLDQLKIIATGIISFQEFGKVGPVQWTEDELKLIVREAHERGIRVMAHASGQAGISLAIAAGVDSLEHGYFIGEEDLKALADKGIAWVPTVAPVGNLLRESGRYSAGEKEVLKRTTEQHLARINQAHALKVRLGVGTDAGAYFTPHGEALFDEMGWLVKAGLPWGEVWKLATLGNARMLGAGDYGRVAPQARMNSLQLMSPEAVFLP